jgi:fructuronate reductase
VTGRLSYATLAKIPPGLRPHRDPRDRHTRIVHLGVGAFHRAHQAVYTEQCGDWGICGFTQRSARVVDQLAPQDGLYTLLVRDAAQVRAQVIGAVRDVRFAGGDPAALCAWLADPAVAVVTLTVTEKGYRHDPATARLRLADPEIAADLAGRPPRTVVGQLAAGLAARARADSGPLTIVCCDNLPSNGATLRGLVEQYVQKYTAQYAANYAAEYAAQYPRHRGDRRAAERLADWIATSVRFPATMVDRIVPATTGADRAEAAALLGVRDEGTVVAEPDTHWVIEDDFAGPRPAWETAGALLVPDVAPYELMKLRVVNGAHSALAYLGGLAGHVYIAGAAADPGLAEYTRRLLTDDVIPTLDPPPGVDLAGYAQRQLGRFANPALHHATAQVAMDGSQKLPQRLLGTIRDRYAAGAQPLWAALAVAAWMRHVATGCRDDGRPFAVDDPLATLFSERLRGVSGPRQVSAALLGVHEVFGDLAGNTGFADLVASHLERLTRDGARVALHSLLAGPTGPSGPTGLTEPRKGSPTGGTAQPRAARRPR